MRGGLGTSRSLSSRLALGWGGVGGRRQRPLWAVGLRRNLPMGEEPGLGLIPALLPQLLPQDRPRFFLLHKAERELPKLGKGAEAGEPELLRPGKHPAAVWSTPTPRPVRVPTRVTARPRSSPPPHRGNPSHLGDAPSSPSLLSQSPRPGGASVPRNRRPEARRLGQAAPWVPAPSAQLFQRDRAPPPGRPGGAQRRGEDGRGGEGRAGMRRAGGGRGTCEGTSREQPPSAQTARGASERAG